MKTHEIKTWSEYFDDIINGKKTFEVRLNDRDYKVGDKLILREWNNVIGEYTGREHDVKVIYILEGGNFGVQAGYVVMSIK